MKRVAFLIMVSVIISLPVSYFVIDWKGLYVSTLGYHSMFLSGLHKRALTGDADAMYVMGENHQYGWNGLRRSDADASEWYRKASELGHAEATNSLALMYRNGDGVGQDTRKAISLFNKAIELGSLHAYSNLGSMYKNGEGVEKDYDKAFGLFKECADKSVSLDFCSGNLGWMYYDGLGTEKSYEKAFLTWLEAAKQGNASAQFQVGNFYDVGKGHIAQDRAKALEWYKKSASQNYAESQRFIGYIYYDGIDGVPQNFVEAGKYFSMAARNGSLKSKELIDYSQRECEAHQAGEFVTNYMRSCKLALHSGSEAAKKTMAQFYYNRGNNFRNVDPPKAFEFFERSANLGFPKGQFHLGMFYYNGEGTEKNDVKAYAYIKQSLNEKGISAEYYDAAKEIVNHLERKLTNEQLKKAKAIFLDRSSDKDTE